MDVTSQDPETELPLDTSLEHEWLLTDGVGGFASSTPAMCATRRYHGLLVTLPAGMAKRHLFLARFDESVRVDGEAFRTACAHYSDGTYVPRGDRLLESWATDPHPTASYRVGNGVLTREVLMARGAPTVLCRYTLRGGAGELELRPLLAFREADSLTFCNDVADTDVERLHGGIRCRLYDMLPAATITLGGAEFDYEHDPAWYRGLEYAEEIERGYDGIEDQLSPGRFRITLEDGESVVIAATTRAAVGDPVAAWDAAVEAQAARRADAASRHRSGSVGDRVDASADDFFYRTDRGRLGICAGYPWFGEWGRDTFLALPGLTLARGRLDVCREVIGGAVPFLRRGLLPNIYGVDQEDSHYGSVDASMWFARAVDLYARAGGNIDPFVPALREIAAAYRDGTDLGIGTDEGGLIAAGGPELNATWMDARTPDGPVTPRDGCAVEINALWYALLDHLAEIDPPERGWAKLRDAVGESFVDRLWLDRGAYLADRWLDGEADDRVRPNMVLAAALGRSPLTETMRRGVVDCATRELLTPRGLRTLAPGHPEYVPQYGGDTVTRDHAYHQGTVWPWLLGFYTEAVLRAYGSDEVPRLRRLWDGFDEELDAAGQGHVSEVFDGDAPHRPGGTIAQAWSSAELLRALALLDEFEEAGAKS